MTVKVTRHPKWVREFLATVAPYQERVVNSHLFTDMANGSLSMRRFRAGLLFFYPLIESFPQYMGMTLARIPAGDSKRNNRLREWLIANINVERKHTLWYRQWARDFGVPGHELAGPVFPPAEIDAINNYLWRITSHGTVAEALAAVNYGIEGPSGLWTKKVKTGIHAYRTLRGVKFRRSTLFWINAHAAYDDTHPEEALEMIKMFAQTKELQEKVTNAVKRSMEYYAMAADAVYDMF